MSSPSLPSIFPIRVSKEPKNKEQQPGTSIGEALQHDLPSGEDSTETGHVIEEEPLHVESSTTPSVGTYGESWHQKPCQV